MVQFLLQVLTWFARVLADPEWIRAVGSLAWPLILLLCVVLFRPQIVSLVDRLRKAKGLGGEVELDQKIEKTNLVTERVEHYLEAKVTEDDDVADQAPPSVVPVVEVPPEQLELPTVSATPPPDEKQLAEPPPPQPAEPAPTGALSEHSQLLRETVFRATLASSPVQALMLVSDEIETEIRAMARESGAVSRDAADAKSMAWIVENLADDGALPALVQSAFGQFWEMRQDIVHRTTPTAAAQARSAIDLGRALLRLIRQVRGEIGLLSGEEIHAIVFRALIEAFHPRPVVHRRPGVRGGPDYIVRAREDGQHEIGVCALTLRKSRPSARLIREACLDVVSWMNHHGRVDDHALMSEGLVLLVVPDYLSAALSLRRTIQLVLSEMEGRPISIKVLPHGLLTLGTDDLVRAISDRPANP